MPSVILLYILQTKTTNSGTMIHASMILMVVAIERLLTLPRKESGCSSRVALLGVIEGNPTMPIWDCRKLLTSLGTNNIKGT